MTTLEDARIKLSIARAEVRAAEQRLLDARKDRDESRRKQQQEIFDHKTRLAAEHGLTEHPKLDQLYALAWEHGHASGFAEVEIYFVDFARLLRP